MATVFLSRVERDTSKSAPASNVGPGAYKTSKDLVNTLPGFVPFSSSSKRYVPGSEDKTQVAPGSYNLDSPFKKPPVTSSFKSSTKRFPDNPKDDDPGPGDYVLKSTIGTAKPQFAKPAIQNILELIPQRSSSPPSIPAKTQSNGYEVLSDGRVKPQPPAIPGYTGVGADSVGPADYHPRVDIKYRKDPKPIFPKAPDRSILDKMLARVSDAPGPGYYDKPSDFDLNPTGSTLHDSDFLVHLNTAKKRQLSVFESKTNRDALLQEVERRRADPGPGQYDIPPAIQAGTKPPNLQFFTSSGPRFQEGQRSMRIDVAPGKYNPITSDFDRLRIKILKQKKMISRSDWAQNIAFVSTEERFKDGHDSDIPAPTAYAPKVGLTDNLPRQNIRGGAFGTTEQRFKEAKPQSAVTKDQMLERELNREINQLLSRPNQNSSFTPNDRAPSPSPIRPKYTANFAPSPDARLRPIKSPPGPPPGAYDTVPKWDHAKGVIPMAPPVVVCKKKPTTSPGPGQYNINRKLGKDPRNPKNIMLSTTTRDDIARNTKAPGPGYYDPSPFIGSLIKQSHNILLSDRY